MKYIVQRFEPDSYTLMSVPIRIFDTWEQAMALIEPLQAKGQRGWRITYAWEQGEKIPLHKMSGGGYYKDPE